MAYTGKNVSTAGKLTGRVAIVTGGARGMGRAIAVELAKAGANLSIADIESSEETVGQIESLGRQALFVKTDVSNSEEVQGMKQATLNEFSKIDFLINNAGARSPSRFVGDTSESGWDKVMSINLKGTFLCCKAVIPQMISQRYGKIVNIGSSLSSRGSVFNDGAGGPSYCASKAGVQNLTRTLAFELAPHGINVNAVAPGIIDTPMFSERDMQRLRAKYLDHIPLGRVGKPEDIAPLVTFLVTDAACYITGQTIHVNGGMLMVD